MKLTKLLQITLFTFAFLLTASFLYADETGLWEGFSVKGSAMGAFGQYDSGVKDKSGEEEVAAEPYFTATWKGDIQFFYEAGPITARYTFEAIQYDIADRTTTDPKFQLKYTWDEDLRLMIGEVIPKESIGFTAQSGIPKDIFRFYGMWMGLTTYAPYQGLGLRYQLSESIDLGMTYFTEKALATNKKGSATQFGTTISNLADSGFSLRFNSISSMADEFDGTSDTGNNHTKITATALGLKYSYDTLWAVSVDFVQRKDELGTLRTYETDSGVKPIGDLPLGAGAYFRDDPVATNTQDIGIMIEYYWDLYEGLKFTYGVTTIQDDFEANATEMTVIEGVAGSDTKPEKVLIDQKSTKMVLVYQNPITSNSVVYGVLINNTIEEKGGISLASMNGFDKKVESYFGGGLYIKF